MKKETLILGFGLTGLLGLGAFLALRSAATTDDVLINTAAQTPAGDPAGPGSAARLASPVRKNADRLTTALSPAGAQNTVVTNPPTSATSSSSAGAAGTEPAAVTTPPSVGSAIANPSTQVNAAAPALPPAIEAAPAAAASQKKADEPTLRIKEDTVIGIRIDQTVSTDSSRLDDRITARVIRDVTVDGHIAIPSGARLEGIVSLVEHNPRGADRRRLGIRFTTLVLADNKRVAIQTDQIFRDSDAPGEPAAALAGGAALGAMLANGGRLNSSAPMSASPHPGAALPRDARIPGGTALTVRLTAAVTIER